MPVTAKLSRQFYERLGDDIASELVEWFNAVDATYRADLRDLNELNFTRFDAKLDQRIGQLKADMDARFAASDAKMEQRIGELKAEIAQLKAEFKAQMDARFSAADAKLEQRIGGLGTEMAAMRADLIKWMFVFVATATLAILGLG